MSHRIPLDISVESRRKVYHELNSLSITELVSYFLETNEYGRTIIRDYLSIRPEKIRREFKTEFEKRSDNSSLLENKTREGYSK